MHRAELLRLAGVALPGSLAVLIASLIVVALGKGSAGNGASGPQIGDHWHAPYAIFILDTRRPAIPEVITPEGVHTHGDGIIHIHPHLPEAEGSGVSLENFFAYIGGRLTATELRVPGDFNTYRDGTVFGESRDGVISDGDVARLRILRADSGFHPLGTGFADAIEICNLKPEFDFEEVGPDYVPRDGDCIRILFGPLE